jgi:hypothetical protein
MTNWKKSLLELVGAIAIIGTFCAAVGIKISELPESEDPPSDNTYIEIADMDQAVKSRKLLLSKLAQTENTVNYISNVVNNYNIVTNNYTNVTWNIETNVFNIKNSTVTITNTSFTINGTNAATINATDTYIPYRAGSNYFGDSTMKHSEGITKVEANVGAVLTVGDTTFVNMLLGSQTNVVSGAVAIEYATNGLHNVELTHIRTWFVPSGGPHTLTIPSGWRTNVYSAVPPALTNGTITKMFVRGMGPTADAASQTNVQVSFEYYK